MPTLDIRNAYLLHNYTGHQEVYLEYYCLCLLGVLSILPAYVHVSKPSK